MPYNGTISNGPQQNWTKKTCSSRSANLIKDCHDLSFPDLFYSEQFFLTLHRSRLQIKLLFAHILLIMFLQIAIHPILNFTQWISKLSIKIIRCLQNLWTSCPSVNQLQTKLPASWLYYLSPTQCVLMSTILDLVFKENMSTGEYRGN